MRVRVFKIKHLVEVGEDARTKRERAAILAALPTELFLEVDDEDAGADEEIGELLIDMVSDKTGYLHEGFNWERARPEDEEGRRVKGRHHARCGMSLEKERRNGQTGERRKRRGRHGRERRPGGAEGI